MVISSQFKLIIAIAIIFIVLGHSHQPANIFYPSYYFQVPLLFFVFGYFLDIRNTFKQKMESVFNFSKHKLTAYYSFNLLLFLGFLILRYLLVINEGEISFFDFFIEPFAGGHQFWLISAIWFIPILCVSYFLVQMLIWGNKSWIGLSLFLILLVVFFISYNLKIGQSQGLYLFIIKTLLSSLYLLFGYNFKLHEQVIRKKILNPTSILLLVVIIEMLRVNFGDLSIYFVNGEIANPNTIVPIISSFLIILLSYIVCHYISFLVNHSAFLENVITYSLFISMLHLFSFILLNFSLLVLGKIYLGDLLNLTYRHEFHISWILYILLGMLLPICFGKLVTRTSQKFLKFTSLF